MTDLQEMRAAEDKVLHNYAWLDQANGIVRIPIDHAMDLLALRGLPTRKESGPQGAGLESLVERGCEVVAGDQRSKMDGNGHP